MGGTVFLSCCVWKEFGLKKGFHQNLKNDHVPFVTNGRFLIFFVEHGRFSNFSMEHGRFSNFCGLQTSVPPEFEK